MFKRYKFWVIYEFNRKVGELRCPRRRATNFKGVLPKKKKRRRMSRNIHTLLSLSNSILLLSQKWSLTLHSCNFLILFNFTVDYTSGGALHGDDISNVRDTLDAIRRNFL